MSVDHPDEIEDRLAALERASDERRAALRSLVDDLPAAVSRRTLVVTAARDLVGAPNKGAIVRRGGRKLARIPGAVVRRVTHR